ncbi:glycosyltransferase family 8 protein [Roridomyces roridus]|uniref:Glycosyltransferase family 8 protein n=1 Tax=Roridomyces roridus TaxID=1738132 RepID=A0AAD7CA38_9AGAR|nr:glycosyltransferase family 8 protein [Roridomyces roridus]
MPSWFNLNRAWTYEPLRQHPADQATRWGKQSKIKLGLGIVLSVGIVLLLARFTFHSESYNPLDNYQNINALPVTHVPSSEGGRRAVVSALYSDGFAIAVAVLGHSTTAANVSARLILPYLEGRISPKALCIVRSTGWEPQLVPFIPPPHDGQSIHARFRDQYTKLNIWTLDKMGIDTAVYLDADTLVRRNFDELFDSPFNFAAVPDVYGAGDPRGFSLTFNAGVLAYRPSSAVFDDMLQKLQTASYPLKQAEQAFLNLYFGGTAMRLPYIYNANLAIKQRSPILWERLVPEMRVIHYTTVKPFQEHMDAILSPEELEEVMDRGARREGGFFREEVGWWREAYERMMREHGDAIRRCY